MRLGPRTGKLQAWKGCLTERIVASMAPQGLWWASRAARLRQ